MATQFQPNPVVFQAQTTFNGSGNPVLGTQVVDENAVKTAAKFAAENVEHRFPVVGRSVAPGTAVTAATEIVHIAKYPGTVESIEAVTTTLPTGGATVTIDYQKSTAGGAFASILTATFVLDAADTVRVPISGVINTSAYIASDVFQIVVTVNAGGSGDTQAAGLLVRAIHHEDPTA